MNDDTVMRWIYDMPYPENSGVEDKEKSKAFVRFLKNGMSCDRCGAPTEDRCPCAQCTRYACKRCFIDFGTCITHLDRSSYRCATCGDRGQLVRCGECSHAHFCHPKLLKHCTIRRNPHRDVCTKDISTELRGYWNDLCHFLMRLRVKKENHIDWLRQLSSNRDYVAAGNIRPMTPRRAGGQMHGEDNEEDESEEETTHQNNEADMED